WGNGHCLGPEDSPCLREAAAQGLTLVTYDRRMIPPLLKTWAEEERTHGGVAFVDEKTILPADIDGLVWALTRLASETGSRPTGFARDGTGIDTVNGNGRRSSA